MTAMHHWEFMEKNEVQNELKTFTGKKKTQRIRLDVLMTKY